MIKLYISTSIPTSCKEIATILGNNKIDCQIYNNSSAIIKNNCFNIEKGYYIKILDPEFKIQNFKTKIWKPLSRKLHLKCAYVISPDFKGCVKNWPGVFTKSNCSALQKNKNKFNIKFLFLPKYE
tara:strand:- start:136 stop:510 length:375 start_codon:yes stop_codon:yes gene_type:complete